MKRDIGTELLTFPNSSRYYYNRYKIGRYDKLCIEFLLPLTLASVIVRAVDLY
jgi:NADH:ubiquinone oxidoreductase subunit H